MMTKLSQPIRIMLVDDHLLFRDGVASLLRRDARFDVVSEASDGVSALENIKHNLLDIVLMDIQMPGMGGIEATRRILASYPDLKVIMITVSAAEQDLFDAIKAGAQGYILKTDTDSQFMCDAIARVAAGEAIIPSAMAPRLLTEFAALAQNQQPEDPPSPQNKPLDAAADKKTAEQEVIGPPPEASLLTAREYQVLELVAQGLPNKGIAGQLVISENTVRSHLRSIMDKLHMNNRVQAALWLKEQKQK